MYLNCVVSYEIYCLLKDSYHRRRWKPPPLRKVTLQALAVYSWSGIVFIIRIFNGRYSERMNKNISTLFFFIISAGIPVLFLMTICFIIWYRTYMPSIGGRMKELTVFFARIILVFVFLWLPGLILVSMGGDESNKYSTNWKGSKLLCIGLLLCAIQPTVSTFLAMTKSDVRVAIFDLITLSHCRRHCCCYWSEMQQHEEEEIAAQAITPRRRRHTTSRIWRAVEAATTEEMPAIMDDDDDDNDDDIDGIDIDIDIDNDDNNNDDEDDDAQNIISCRQTSAEVPTFNTTNYGGGTETRREYSTSLQGEEISTSTSSIAMAYVAEIPAIADDKEDIISTSKMSPHLSEGISANFYSNNSTNETEIADRDKT